MHKRARINRLSDGSRDRLLWAVRNEQAPLRVLFTVTYPAEFPNDGRLVKAHWAALRHRLRRRDHEQVGYWCLEWQKRGAAHLHAVCSSEVPKAWLAEAWYNVVGSGDPRHLQAGTRVERIRGEDGAARYMAKYAAKREQKTVPPGYREVGRLWGRWGPRGDKEEVTGEAAEQVAAVLREEADRRVGAGEYAPRTEHSFYLQDTADAVRSVLGANLRPISGVGGGGVDNLVPSSEGAQCDRGQHQGSPGVEGLDPRVSEARTRRQRLDGVRDGD